VTVYTGTALDLGATSFSFSCSLLSLAKYLILFLTSSFYVKLCLQLTFQISRMACKNSLTLASTNCRSLSLIEFTKTINITDIDGISKHRYKYQLQMYRDAENLSVNWSHIHWPNFGKGENKGSVLLWYSCFDHSILMFVMCEGLQLMSYQYIETLSDEAVKRYQSADFCFKQLSRCDVRWPREWPKNSRSKNLLIHHYTLHFHVIKSYITWTWLQGWSTVEKQLHFCRRNHEGIQFWISKLARSDVRYQTATARTR